MRVLTDKLEEELNSEHWDQIQLGLQAEALSHPPNPAPPVTCVKHRVTIYSDRCEQTAQQQKQEIVRKFSSYLIRAWQACLLDVLDLVFLKRTCPWHTPALWWWQQQLSKFQAEGKPQGKDPFHPEDLFRWKCCYINIFSIYTCFTNCRFSRGWGNGKWDFVCSWPRLKPWPFMEKPKRRQLVILLHCQSRNAVRGGRQLLFIHTWST